MSKVYFIGAGPGDIELITLKGLKALQKSKIVIYAGSLVNRDILNYADNMIASYDSSSMVLEEIVDLIKTSTDKNLDVARLHTGDASLYGAIFEQIVEIEKLGIQYEIIPGVTALFAAAASMGVELTSPNISQTVTITRVEGKTPMPKNENLKDIVSHGGTFTFYLSILKLKDIINTFLDKGFKKDTPVAVCYRVSWPDEEIIFGTLDNIEKKMENKKINRQALVIVGDVLRRNPKKYSKLYDKDFSHGFRQ